MEKKRVRANSIFLFIVVWQFFWANNRVLRIYPYVLWPTLSAYALYRNRCLSKTSAKYFFQIAVALCWCLCSSMFSPNMNSGVAFVLEVALYILPSIYIAEKCDYEQAIDFMHGLALVHALMLYIQFLLPNVFYQILEVLAGSSSASEIRTAANNGLYVGLTGQTSVISFYLVVGIGTTLYRYSKKHNLMELIKVALFFIAVLLTNRRGNFICSIAILSIYFIIGKERIGSKILIALIGTIMLLSIGIENIPGMSGMLEKFTVLNQSRRVLSGRDDLWKVAIQLFEDNPIVGSGFSSFSYYVDKTSAHNSYIQKLAEMGILGTLVFFFPFLSCLWKTSCELCRSRKQGKAMEKKFRLLTFCVLLQVYYFMIAFTEGVFETPALFVIIFMVQTMGNNIVSGEYDCEN